MMPTPSKIHFTWQPILRAVKSALAGVAAIYIADLLKLPQSYWAAISALVVMGADVGETIKASRDRLLGTAIGAMTGGAFAFFEKGNLLWFGGAVAVATLICEVLNLKQSLRLAGTTVAIIMLTAGSATLLSTIIHRVVEVSLGIVVALAITAIPPRLAGDNT